jgi:mannose-6-phosphate isomerase-like protein (cupin superfamily)
VIVDGTLEVAMSTVTMDRPLRHDRPVILDPLLIDHLSWQPVPGCPGVRAKELWRTSDTVCALLDYQPGAGTPGRPHRHARQHLWVITGRVVLDGRLLDAGSYVEVPAGTYHPIRAAVPSGAVVLQMHHRSTSGGW